MNKFFAAILNTCVLLISCSEKHYSDALSPDEALRSFDLNKDFNIELFAAEPYVLDPVEMVFDEEGNAFVVEMSDYPYKPESGIGGGRILLLSDTNSDGRVDRSTVFADSILDPTSILPWKGGLIVAAAPDIFYLKDTDGDHHADTRELLFTGFFNKNNEAQITNLRFCVDNWIYAGNFGQAGKVTPGNNPGAAGLDMTGADFRFRLDRGAYELETTGPTQFGQSIDDWGHRFLTQNSIHIQQAVIPWRYLHRHPYLPFSKTSANISDHDPLMYPVTSPPYWRVERTKRRNKAFQEQHLPNVEYAEGHFTAASGGTIYAGDAFPQKYYGNVFTGDVSGNLIHRDILIAPADSVTLVAKRDEDEKSTEFLTSTDPWFRPVTFTSGPDGMLYVIDMYRQHVEGPAFVPDDLKSEMDYSNGNRQGRIYRIVPKNAAGHNTKLPDLKNVQSGGLVELLSNPNQWWRLQAQRILLERQDMSAVPALKNLFATHQDPRVRLHALFALEGLHSLDAEITGQAIKDPHPGVRESGIILSEKFPQLLPQLIDRTKDSSARVAFQATLSLGEFPASGVEPALAGVVEKHGQDHWFRTAVLSSEAGSSFLIIEILIKQGFFPGEVNLGKTAFLEDFSYIIGARNREGEIARLLKLLTTESFKKGKALQIAGLTGLAKGIKKSENKIKADPQVRETLKNMEADSTKEIKEAVVEISKLME